MAKTYEALERAERHVEPPESEGLPNIPSERPTSSGACEKLMALYEGIETKLGRDKPKVITFMAAGSEDSTSTLIRKLAELASDDLGKRVVLFELQRTGEHSGYFATHPEGDCAEVINGQRRLEDVLKPVHGSTLFLGHVTTNGKSVSALSAKAGFCKVVEQLRNTFDLVLFDASTTTNASDALTVAVESDGVVLVVEAETTRRQVAENTSKKIVARGGEILGVILNKRQHHIPKMVYKRL